MSYFMAYFEIANKKSLTCPGFADVGRYIFPKRIYGGPFLVSHNGKIYKASIVTDFSKQSANNYFLKNGKSVRDELMNFIAGRISNESIIPCITGYIDTGQETVFSKGYQRNCINNFSDFFGGEPCVGKSLEISSRNGSKTPEVLV